MKCPHCGNELKDDAKFCDKCGAGFGGNDSTSETVNPANAKKKIYKRWYFWVIIVVAIMIVGGVNGAINGGNSSNKSKQETTAANQSETKEKATEAVTTQPATEKPTKDPKKVEKEYKDGCKTIDFKTLSRNPDKYKDNDYKFEGKIIQVQEGWGDSVDLRINVTKEENEYLDEPLWTDTIYATVEIPDGEDKLLEDDVITFWGTCDGNYTYETVMGNNVSLPKIDIKYYELNN
nr:zinc ribbon domain-containing protein [uncultured Ruminococcus sp.]